MKKALKGAHGVMPAFASITDWCALSGLSRRTTYDCLRNGRLRAVKQGNRTLIDVKHGLKYIQSLPPYVSSSQGTDSS
jgi:excisionase family DNA binding protein